MSLRSKYDMYYGATREIQEKAKFLRRSETAAEKIIWKHLKSRKLNGLKFRRQHPIFQFIADFYCHEIKLVIEVDGENHNRTEIKE